MTQHHIEDLLFKNHSLAEIVRMFEAAGSEEKLLKQLNNEQGFTYRICNLFNRLMNKAGRRKKVA